MSHSQPRDFESVRDQPADRNDRLLQLFQTEYRSLLRIALGILGDPAVAEEVVMDSFEKVASGWKGFRTIERQPAYLRKVVVNLCRSRLRRQSIERRVNQRFQSLYKRTPESGSDDELKAVVWEAVMELPPRQRTFVVLRYVEDLTEAEIANVSDASLGSVKSQLSKARHRLEHLIRKKRALGDT